MALPGPRRAALFGPAWLRPGPSSGASLHGYAWNAVSRTHAVVSGPVRAVPTDRIEGRTIMANSDGLVGGIDSHTDTIHVALTNAMASFIAVAAPWIERRSMGGLGTCPTPTPPVRCPATWRTTRPPRTS